MAGGHGAAGPAVASAPVPADFFEREDFDDDLYGDHIVQYPGDYSLCLGCRSCELLCGLVKDGRSGLNRSCIHVHRGSTRTNMHEIQVCKQCWDHPCYEACPKKDTAMRIDPETGVVYIVEEDCIGCGKCAKACIFTPSRIAMVGKKRERKARKCDLCRGREGGPVCVSQCPALCIEPRSMALSRKEA